MCKMFSIHWLLIIIGTKALPSLGHFQHSEGPIVQTAFGLVRGTKTSRSQNFYGIPYADSPTGQYRWKHPRKLSPWRGIYNATYPRAGCTQVCNQPPFACPLQISEDCLYLNVFVPLAVNVSAFPKVPLPVMVWIHGGNFKDGAGSVTLFDGRFLSNLTYTIVVTINYRLGALGFLVTGNHPETSTAGNYGFLDQQAALLWVQQNIMAFGGDPNKVTLFGQSAGAQSVALHLTVQSSELLFQQAIIESLPFSLRLKTRTNAIILGEYFSKLSNCSTKDLACLMALTPNEIIAAQIKAANKDINPCQVMEAFEPWGPHIDGEIIKEETMSAFIQAKWQKEKPIILGTTTEEAILFVYEAFSSPVSKAAYYEYLSVVFNRHTPWIVFEYPPLQTQDQRLLLSKVATDYIFLCPTRKVAQSITGTGSSVWLYVFSYKAIVSKAWGNRTYCYNHVCHGSELPFVWDTVSLLNYTFTPEEQTLVNYMMCFWGNFAYHGNPNSNKDHGKFSELCTLQPVINWPQYTLQNSWFYLNFTLAPNVQGDFHRKHCVFWDKLNIY